MSCTQHKVSSLHHMIPGEALAKWFQSDYMQLYCTYTYVAAAAEVVTVAVVTAGAGAWAGTRTGAAVAVVVVEVVRVGVVEVVVLHVNNNNITIVRNITCNYIILLRKTKGQFKNLKIQV